MWNSRLPRVAYKYASFKIQRAHPLTLTLALAALIALTLILMTIGFSRAARSAAFASPPAPVRKTTLHDGRANAAPNPAPSENPIR